MVAYRLDKEIERFWLRINAGNSFGVYVYKSRSTLDICLREQGKCFIAYVGTPGPNRSIWGPSEESERTKV